MKKGRFIWGLFLILAAVALIVYCINPTLGIFSFPLWKLIACAFLLFWAVENACFGHSLGERLGSIVPLAIIFVILKPEIATWNPAVENVSGWVVIVCAILLSIGMGIVFGNIGRTSSKKSNGEVQPTTCEKNSFSGRSCVLDSTSENHEVDNKFGQLDVSFGNMDMVNAPNVLYLHVDNAFGQTVIHVPADWEVKNQIQNSLGAVNIRRNPDATVRTLVLTGENHFGEVKVI